MEQTPPACSALTCSGGLLFKAGQDGFEKCALDELADDLPGAGFRISYRTRDIHPGGNFLLRPVFQQFGDPADQDLVHLTSEAPSPVLSSVVDLHILEERLDITGYSSISDVQFRYEGKDPGGYIEITVGAQDIVHGRQLSLSYFE